MLSPSVLDRPSCGDGRDLTKVKYCSFIVPVVDSRLLLLLFDVLIEGQEGEKEAQLITEQPPLKKNF